jgi:hypothetical protein
VDGPQAVEMLANIDLFRGLSPRDLQRVADMTKELSFATGQASPKRARFRETESAHLH